MADDNFEELVRQSAMEQPEADLSDASGGIENQSSTDFSLNHPASAVFAWLLCLTMAYVVFTDPLPANRMVGSRSEIRDLSVSVYHAAHRVETFRRFTGHLPEYFDPEWGESTRVTYELTEEGSSYLLTGKMGELVITFKPGDDPESLLHFTQFRDAQLGSSL